ncbi:MAG: cytidine deaminase [Pseudomonadales bacterium]|nr:cytidine deaminase [Pseudomonadales bacterium]
MDADALSGLVDLARRTMKNAYVPVTGFPVGAAVLSKNGQMFGGCNTQSVISGMGVCAERSAIDHAVVNGHYCFDAIAVVSTLEEPIAPCGMCLQYIGEFSQVADGDIEILMVGASGHLERSSIRKLSHRIFGPSDLGLDLAPYRHRHG